jgi:hypothetical protein
MSIDPVPVRCGYGALSPRDVWARWNGIRGNLEGLWRGEWRQLGHGAMKISPSLH